ncbi:hypothetical protein FHT28_006244 [Rhizobium sp. SG570]|nr:hypothetical protein [Rhizobium sp. SG570]NRP88503.1 hypothetical protein [Ensifer adhaerens]
MTASPKTNIAAPTPDFSGVEFATSADACRSPHRLSDPSNVPTPGFRYRALRFK